MGDLSNLTEEEYRASMRGDDRYLAKALNDARAEVETLTKARDQARVVAAKYALNAECDHGKIQDLEAELEAAQGALKDTIADARANYDDMKRLAKERDRTQEWLDDVALALDAANGELVHKASTELGQQVENLAQDRPLKAERDMLRDDEDAAGYAAADVKDHARLVTYFRDEEPDEGRAGDDAGRTTSESAIRLMQRRRQLLSEVLELAGICEAPDLHWPEFPRWIHHFKDILAGIDAALGGEKPEPAKGDEAAALAYSYSVDDEAFHGAFPTREAALEEALSLGTGTEQVWTAQNVPITCVDMADASVSAHNVLERLSEEAHDAAGEAAHCWPDYASGEPESLREALMNVVAKWLETHGFQPHFFGVTATQKHLVVQAAGSKAALRGEKP